MKFRTLEGESASDMVALQRLLDRADEYFNRITGYPAGLAENQTLYSSLPEGVSYEDKFLFGLFDGNSLLCCADVIRGYPRLNIAEIGTFIVDWQVRRRGYGARTMAEIEERAKTWPGIDRLRCEVPVVLHDGIKFLEAGSFAATGESRAYEYARVKCEQIVLEKRVVWH